MNMILHCFFVYCKEITGVYNQVVTADTTTGDKMIITTETNNKKRGDVQAGVTSNINHYLVEDSEFVQLSHGLNTLKYNVASGIDYLHVSISYLSLYWGISYSGEYLTPAAFDMILRNTSRHELE